MKQIQPDVHWLNGGSSNFYLCRDEAGLALIDTGMPKREKLVLDAIARLGYRPADLTRILLTHADIDHVGSAAALQGLTGAKVYAGAATAVFLPNGRSPKHMPWLAQWVIDRFMHYAPISPAHTVTFVDGEVLPVMGGLQALATPGHTLDHFSFYCPASGVLFAGDALNTRNGRLQATPQAISADINAARQSAIRLLELAPAVIACGHGTPSTNHTAADLSALFNNLRLG